MANTAFVCYKLIDDIVKRGGQEVSDRYIVKACLNRVVLSNKKFTTNQLLLQTGIKSQNCTIDNQLISQRQPKAFKKDQYMSKSLQKNKDKKKLINIPQKLHVSCNKIKHKKQLSAMTPQLKAPDNNVKQKKKQENKFFIQLQDKATKQKHKISNQQQKIYDKMRAYILNKQTTAIQQQAEAKKYEEQRSTQFKKAHSNFKKQFSNQGSDHTYHTDGKFLVFPIKNKQKCINNVFPVSLHSKVEGQQFSNKKKIINPEQFKIKTGTSFFAEETIKTNEKQPEQVHRNSPQVLQKHYNNNHKRQVSSVNYLEVKPGICFTEPSSGKSVRGQLGTKSQYILLKQKKSCFSKFVTSDNRSKTDGFSTFKNQNRDNYNYKKQSGIICKTQPHFSQRINFLATFSRRTKQSKQIGTIRDINQNLLDSLIDFK